jgi:peptidoglycan hydrolase-like protein with peptidoglycan-binding domain
MAGFHNGKGYYDPIKFCKAVIEFEKAQAEAGKETPEDAPATLAPTHSVPEIPTVAVPTEAKVVPASAVAAPAVAPAKMAYPGKYIKVGAKGDAVKYIQKKLGLAVDGSFGPATDKAVKALQKKHGLTADGIIGPKTWAKLG